MANNITRFEKVSPERQFYFIDFTLETIEKKEFIKINVLDKFTKETFSIYKENDNGVFYDLIDNLQDFEDIDDRIFVVYKNGRLKFDFRG